MTGDSDSELEGAGEAPTPTPAQPPAADDRSHHPRPFRSWASAQEEEKGPSVWSRIGQRVSGMFSKPKAEPEGELLDLEATPMELESEALELEAESVELHAAPAAPEQEVQWIVSETPTELEPQAVEPPALEPVDSEPESEPETDATPEVLSAAAIDSDPDFQPETYAMPEVLSSAAMDSDPVVMWEPDAPAPEMAEPQASGPTARSLLDDSSESEQLSGSAPVEPERPKRPSLIARLFGRKTKAVDEGPLDGQPIPEPVASEAPSEYPVWGQEPVEQLLPDAPLVDDGASLVDDGASLVDGGATRIDDGELRIDEAEPRVDDGEPRVDDGIEMEPALEPAARFIEAIPEMPTEPPRRGFFARLFGRKASPAVDEQPAEEPIESLVAESLPALDAVAEEAVGEEAATDSSEEPFVEAPAGSDTYFDAPAFETSAVATAPDDPVRDDLAILSASVDDEEVVRTNEYPVEVAPEVTSDEPFTSVDEALPVAAEPTSPDLMEAIESVPVSEPKPGFFGRLFSRRSKPVLRPSLEIEIHEDRIEAAAHALDEVSGESFSASVAEPRTADEMFASVEDALPSVDEAEPAPVPSLDEVLPVSDLPSVPMLDDQRFAPPPPPALSSPAMQESGNTLEIEPFDPFGEREQPDTLEVGEESRSTMEMQQESRSTVEVEADFSETLEIDEKTDEFAVPVPDVDTGAPTGDLDDGPDTLEVSKQTWLAKIFGFRKKDKDKVADVGATVVEGTSAFLFSKFRAFYNEIIRFKHQKTEFTAGFSTAIVTDYAADLSPEASADAQSKALAQMLELQAAEANWMGGEARDRYPDAQYAMAALADEIFTHLEWEGQTAWPKHLLEVKLYRTHAADVELFSRIDKLLKEKPNSPVARDLARVYLLVIAAGFQGKYRPFGLTRALADYRQRLYEYIHNGDALMLYAPERKIFPEAASRTLEGQAVSRFTAAQRWAAILVFLLVGYTVLAHFAWNRVSADLKDVTGRIRTAGATTGTGSSAPGTTTSSASGAR